MALGLPHIGNPGAHPAAAPLILEFLYRGLDIIGPYLIPADEMGIARAERIEAHGQAIRFPELDGAPDDFI